MVILQTIKRKIFLNTINRKKKLSAFIFDTFLSYLSLIFSSKLKDGKIFVVAVTKRTETLHITEIVEKITEGADS